MSRMRHEDGFSLIELLVAMTVSLVVLSALLFTFENFVDQSQDQTRLADASDTTRETLDRFVATARDASNVIYNGSDDVVYLAGTTAAPRYERICLDNTSQELRYTASSTAITSGGGACSGTKVLGLVSSSVFRYDNPAPASIRAIGVTLTAATNGPKRTLRTTLRTSVALRSRVQVKPTRPPTSVRCDPVTGQNIVSVDLTAGNDPLGPLTVRYEQNGTTVGVGNLLTLGPGDTQVVMVVTNAVGGVLRQVLRLECQHP